MTIFIAARSPMNKGLEELKKLGITTIIDLRAEDRPKSDWEKKEAERLGMHFVQIPIAGFAAPTNEEVVQFFSLTRDPQQKYLCTVCWARIALEYSSRRTG